MENRHCLTLCFWVSYNKDKLFKCGDGGARKQNFPEISLYSQIYGQHTINRKECAL